MGFRAGLGDFQAAATWDWADIIAVDWRAEQAEDHKVNLDVKTVYWNSLEVQAVTWISNLFQLVYLPGNKYCMKQTAK